MPDPKVPPFPPNFPESRARFRFFLATQGEAIADKLFSASGSIAPDAGPGLQFNAHQCQ